MDTDGKLKLARHTMQSKVTTESDTYMEGGTFWPLSYWGSKVWTPSASLGAALQNAFAKMQY